LKELFKEGRIEIGCGMFVMPDMTLVNGESLIRQAESGKKWVREHLGSDVVTGWIADCWGHHRQFYR
jgi:alpha-mannosidase